MYHKKRELVLISIAVAAVSIAVAADRRGENREPIRRPVRQMPQKTGRVVAVQGPLQGDQIIRGPTFTLINIHNSW